MNLKALIENRILEQLAEDESFITEEVEIDPKGLEALGKKIEKDFGMVVKYSTSNLGGSPSYFIKVFGPENTWKNGIALNSPFHATFLISDNTLEMSNNSYQIRNAKAKMRKTKFKTQSELEKKLYDYFKKNSDKIGVILGEEIVTEETIYIKRRYKSLGGNQFANDVGFAKKISNAAIKAGLNAKLDGDNIAVTGDTENIEKFKKSVKGVSFMKEAKDDYQIYHKTFSSAVQHAIQQVEKRGYGIDEEDWDRKVALGPRKPSSGKTNIYTIDLMKNGKETKRKLQMQVYYDEGRYELNMYIS